MGRGMLRLGRRLRTPRAGSCGVIWKTTGADGCLSGTPWLCGSSEEFSSHRLPRGFFEGGRGSRALRLWLKEGAEELDGVADALPSDSAPSVLEKFPPAQPRSARTWELGCSLQPRERLGLSKKETRMKAGWGAKGTKAAFGGHAFRLNPRKNFFPLRVTEPWPRLPRGAVESPSLEIFKTRLDKVLYSLL